MEDRAWLGPSIPVLTPTPPAGAVCEFCQARESELYQKEVSKAEARGGASLISTALLSPLSSGVTLECPGGTLLPPVDTVPALPGQLA